MKRPIGYFGSKLRPHAEGARCAIAPPRRARRQGMTAHIPEANSRRSASRDRASTLECLPKGLRRQGHPDVAREGLAQRPGLVGAGVLVRQPRSDLGVDQGRPISWCGLPGRRRSDRGHIGDVLPAAGARDHLRRHEAMMTGDVSLAQCVTTWDATREEHVVRKPHRLSGATRARDARGAASATPLGTRGTRVPLSLYACARDPHMWWLLDIESHAFLASLGLAAAVAR